MNELQELLSLHRPFHSAFQIDHLILARSGMTDFGILKQALRELHSRYHALCGMEIDIREARMDLDELEARPMLEPRDKLKLAKLRLRIDSNERQYTDTLREFARFFGHARELRKRLGSLTPERWEELDAAEWFAQVRKAAALEMHLAGRPSQSTLDSIMAFGKADRLALLEGTSKPEMQQAWLAQHEHNIPDVPASISLDEVRQMISGTVRKLELVSKETPAQSGEIGPHVSTNPSVPRVPLMGRRFRDEARLLSVTESSPMHSVL